METINTESTAGRVFGIVLIVGGTIAILLSAYLYLTGNLKKPSKSKPANQASTASVPAPPNQITEISYTQDIEPGNTSGEYRVILKMTNQGSAKTNQLPNVLLDFLAVDGQPGQRVGHQIIPTAIYRATEYAPYEFDSRFTQHQLILDIKVPTGTQVIASCLTYAGPADMASPRCSSKITNELNQPTQGATQ